MAVSFWGLLGVLSVYFLGARLLGRPAAAAAALLLALNVVQVWFARYPNADIVMQALLFAALIASARAHVDDDGFFAPVAGTLLGLLLFLRIDAVVAIGAVIAGLALGYAVRQRLYWTFWPPLAAAAALAIWYLHGPDARVRGGAARLHVARLSMAIIGPRCGGGRTGRCPRRRPPIGRRLAPRR